VILSQYFALSNILLYFGSKTRYAVVTMGDGQTVICSLLNGTVFSELE